MIIATAGHVDHGKTTLVRALTGVDTDRLPEEKRRGMSIDLGFAHADLGGPQPVGFVDVPGHERFLRNMLAGVAAVDFALLVVAADDGVMPQTREHLAVLDLLGLRLGAVALTKIDRVDSARIAAVTQQVADVLAPTSLRGAPVFPLAATTGAGIDALRAHLSQAQRTLATRAASGNFRLAVDRNFTLTGAGLVVTGAVFSGSVRPGDALLLSPAGVPVRVRAIHAHDRPVEQASAGMRCALSLAGDLKRVDVGRGDWIVAPAAHAPTMRIDARLRLLPDAGQPLAHWAPVLLHLGAAAQSARVALLEGRALAPGGEAYAQLVLDRPLATLHGDRLILRAQASQRVIAGGVALDPLASDRRIARPARLARLDALAHGDAAQALSALLAAEPKGIVLDSFIRGRNLNADEAGRLRQTVDMHVVDEHGGMLALGSQRWSHLLSQALAALADWHAQQPDGLGLAETALSSRLHAHALPGLARAAIRALIGQGAILREHLLLRLPAHSPRLPAEEEALLARIVPLLREAGLRPPIVGELAAALGMERAALIPVLDRISRLGYLQRVAPNRYFLPDTVEALAAIAAELAHASPDGEFDAIAYRNRSGIGRNLAIEVLEHLDRSGYTRFAGGRRRMVG
jgi:selenocysteine-specific elongation factor